MKIAASFLACAAIGAAAAAPTFQDSTSTAGARPLRPVQAPDPGQGDEADGARSGAPLRPFLGETGSGGHNSAAPPGASATAGELEESYRSRLATRDVDARMDAFQAIAEEASSNPAAKTALQAIADDTADADLAFAARLALRESDRIDTWGRAGSAFGGQGFQVPTDPFEAMRRQMDSVFGADPFFDDVFKNDPFFQRGFGGSRGVFGPDPFGGANPFKSMEERVERMRQEMDAMRRQSIRGGGAQAPNRGWASRSSSMSVQMTDDGIRVEITEDKGDGPETQVYEAPTKEDLLRAHPELEGRLR